MPSNTELDKIFAPIQSEYDGGEPMLPGTIPNAKSQIKQLLIKAKIEALEKARTEQGGHNLEELCCDMCDDIDALTSQLGDTK